MKTDARFKSIIKYERNKYDKNGKPNPKLERENDIFIKFMNLEYMGHKKICKHINKKVLEEVTKSEQSKWLDIN